MLYPPSFIRYLESIERRLTSVRKNILYLLWLSKKPLKAYEILNSLVESKLNAQPATVYRVLDYFVTIGIVHKIECIQSYTLCHEPKKRLASEALMVCNRCHSVSEVYDKAMITKIQQLTQKHGFYLGENVIELKGTCKNCNEPL